LYYKLFVDDGDDFTSSYHELTNYYTSFLGVTSSYTADDTTDLLVLGKVYRFVYVAHNAYGDSDYSNELIAGFGSNPPAPNAPSITLTVSN
jgi:hypothetical protein